MGRGFTLLLSLLAALVAAAYAHPQALTAALGASALILAGVMLRVGPRATAWRLATIGAAAWAVEEVAWSVARLTGQFTYTLVTDVAYYLGAAAWAAALLLLPGRRLPRPLVLAALPPGLLLAWLLLSNFALNVEYVFPFVEFGLLLVALPFVGGLMRSGASPGRLLVLMGFFFRALAAVSYTWLDGGTDPSYLLLWLLSFVTLSAGVYMELNDTHVDFVAAGVTVVTLQLAAARLLTQINAASAASSAVPKPMAGVVVAALAYLQLAVVVLILLQLREERLILAAEQRTWTALLERLLASSGREANLEELLARTLRTIPHLVGIEVHGEARLGRLIGYQFPLVAGGAEVGRLYFERQPRAVSALDGSAPLLAARLQQVRELMRLRVAAETDPLTGLLNRRGFEAAARRLLAAEPDGRLISVALLDIDHFKRVNDVYGHRAGDEALRVLAQILTDHANDGDLVVRWGGEEFLMVLGSDLEGASRTVSAVRRALSGASIGEVAWRIDASAGLAGGEALREYEQLTAWLEQADAALLRAKDLGRNRLELAAD